MIAAIRYRTTIDMSCTTAPGIVSGQYNVGVAYSNALIFMIVQPHNEVSKGSSGRALVGLY